MGSVYKAPERRVRTLLQSFDTARFNGDHIADRLTDINQARSEILSAVLLGHEIVLPAGVLADCPAAMTLIPEILPPYFEFRETISRLSGNRYDPFRIGVERRFTVNGASAYDSYISEYAETINSRSAKWINLEEMWGDAFERSAISELARRYVARDWKGIRDIAGSFADFAKLVADYVSRNDHNNAAPVICRDGLLTRPGKLTITRRMQSYLAKLERRGMLGDDIDALRSGIKTANSAILHDAVNPGERGPWYVRREDFGNSWPYARIWLDQIMHRRMVQAFDIDLPSYFTQELEDKKRDRALGLAYMDDSSIEAFEADIQAGAPSMPPALAMIDWAKIWELIAQEEVQNQQNRLQVRLASLRHALRTDVQRIRRIGPDNSDERINNIRANANQEMGEAVDEFIDFIQSGEKTVILKRDKTRLIAFAGKQPKPLKDTRTGKGLTFGTAVSIGVSVDVVTGGSGLGTATMVGLTVAEQLSGKAISSGLLSTIDRIRRPRNRDVAKEMEFYTAARDQVNFWIAP